MGDGTWPRCGREEWGPEGPAIERQAGLRAGGGRHLAAGEAGTPTGCYAACEDSVAPCWSIASAVLVMLRTMLPKTTPWNGETLHQ